MKQSVSYPYMKCKNKKVSALTPEEQKRFEQSMERNRELMRRLEKL
ncbi:hypothetical protein [Methanohalophilus sp. RSK]|nr:hypothetical protein [Methanohalophilus sp. RSK]